MESWPTTEALAIELIAGGSSEMGLFFRDFEAEFAY